MKGSGDPADWEKVDQWDGGAGWIAFPDEQMQRASHALSTDAGVFLVDPVDVDGLDDYLADLGEVAGVVVLLDRHKRDCAALARRHEVPVYVPQQMHSVANELDADTEIVRDGLPDTDYAAVTVVDNPIWTEVALWNDERKELVVPEAVGTVDYFCAKGESLGVHPMLRAFPPRSALGGLDPETIRVGHGAGVSEDASDLLADALAGSRKRMLGLYAKTATSMLG